MKAQDLVVAPLLIDFISTRCFVCRINMCERNVIAAKPEHWVITPRHMERTKRMIAEMTLTGLLLTSSQLLSLSGNQRYKSPCLRQQVTSLKGRVQYFRKYAFLFSCKTDEKINTTYIAVL